MYYNTKLKQYPDGTVQGMYYEKPKEVGYKVGERNKTGLHIERKEKENASRAVRKVYDLARSNEFDWFVTMTFDKSKVVDRFDYDACADALKKFTDILRHNGNKWIVVAEQHKKGGYHFHGLVSGELPVTKARSAKTGRLIKKNGHQLYNVDNYKYGFTTASKIVDRACAATYLTKYLTKEISVPKGRKRYWASRGLNKPSEELLQMTSAEYGEIFNSARYQKVINTLCWGSFLMCET